MSQPMQPFYTPDSGGPNAGTSSWWNEKPSPQGVTLGRSFLPPAPSPSPLSLPPYPSQQGVSLSDQIQHRGAPGWSNVTDPRTKKRLTTQQAQQLGPLRVSGWRTGGFATPQSSTDAHVSNRIGHGLDEFYRLNPYTPTAEQQHATNLMLNPSLPMRAMGGPVAPGQPFIAGDPQSDGTPNPELIVPTPAGTQVIPLKQLPQLAYGTTPSTVNYSDAYVPGFSGIKNGGAGGAFGEVRTLPGMREAYDASGRVVGYSPLPPAPASVAAAPPTLPPAWTPQKVFDTAQAQHAAGNITSAQLAQAQDGFNRIAKLNEPEAAAAELMRTMLSQNYRDNAAAKAEEERQRRMNPEGITVGVTPRAALTGFLPPHPDTSGPNIDQRRINRQVERLAKTPQGALAIYRGQQEQAAAEAAAQERATRNVFNQQRIDARTGATIDAQNERARMAQEAAMQKDAQKLALDQNEQQVRMMGQQQRFISLVQSGRIPREHADSISQIAQPDALKARLDYYEFSQPKADPGLQEVAPGAGVYMNPSFPGAGAFQQVTPPGTMVTANPGAPQFKQIPKTPPKRDRSDILAEIKRATDIIGTYAVDPKAKTAAQNALEASLRELAALGGSGPNPSPTPAPVSNPNAAYFKP